MLQNSWMTPTIFSSTSFCTALTFSNKYSVFYLKSPLWRNRSSTSLTNTFNYYFFQDAVVFTSCCKSYTILSRNQTFLTVQLSNLSLLLLYSQTLQSNLSRQSTNLSSFVLVLILSFLTDSMKAARLAEPPVISFNLILTYSHRSKAFSTERVLEMTYSRISSTKSPISSTRSSTRGMLSSSSSVRFSTSFSDYNIPPIPAYGRFPGDVGLAGIEAFGCLDGELSRPNLLVGDMSISLDLVMIGSGFLAFPLLLFLLVSL